MKKEKIILLVIATAVGIIIAVGAFYIYQSSKRIEPEDIKNISIDQPTPTPASGLFLTVDTPTDETVTDEKTIVISGKTVPDAKILIVTSTKEVAAVPTSDGDFSTDIALDPDENIIEINSIASNGEIVKVRRVVSFVSEDF